MITYHTKEGKFKVRYYENIPLDKLDRLNGPAVKYKDGTKEWWQNGNLHRLDGPAVEWNDGRKEWWVKGKRHRVDGPAIIWHNGTKEWYINGKLHRLDGPAVEWINGERKYWINGKIIETLEVETWIKENNINLKTKQHQVLFMVKFG